MTKEELEELREIEDKLLKEIKKQRICTALPGNGKIV